GEIELRVRCRAAAQGGAALVERVRERGLRLVEGAAGVGPIFGGQRAQCLLQGEQLAALVAEELDARFFERVGAWRAGERGDAARREVGRGLQVLRERGRAGIRKHRVGHRQKKRRRRDPGSRRRRGACGESNYAAFRAARTLSAIAPKAAGSRTAMSARIFRSISMPALPRPLMNTL